MSQALHVAVAVIRNSQQQVLLSFRTKKKHQGGLWEFPGGKVEADETAVQALVREIDEELGLQVLASQPLIQVRHAYPDLSVLLDVYEVTAFTGTPQGRENQPIKWVDVKDLTDYPFPAANVPIVQAAQLPKLYAITPQGLADQSLLAGVRQQLTQGVKLIQWRDPMRTEADYQALIQPLVELCQTHNAQLAIKSQTAPWADYPQVIWHLSSAQLAQFSQQGLAKQGLLAASCHDLAQLQMAQTLAVDFVTLSPVQSTASHPEAAVLGWEQATQLIAQVNMPVFLLGGLSPEQLVQAQKSGAQGVAAIRSLWPQ